MPKTHEIVLPDPKRTIPPYPVLPSAALPTFLEQDISVSVALVTAASAASIPAGSTVHQVTVRIDTGYTAGATLAVSCGAVTLLAAADIDAQTVDVTFDAPETLIAVAAPVTVTVAGAPVVGAAVVFVTYSTPAG